MGITARAWREYPQRYRMEAAKCTVCGHVCFPPRMVCPQCGARTFTTICLSDRGIVKTFSVIRVAPTGFEDEVPYAVAIVELNGVRTMMQITDCEPLEIRIGMPVQIEFRKVREEGLAGTILYGYKAVPARD